LRHFIIHLPYITRIFQAISLFEKFARIFIDIKLAKALSLFRAGIAVLIVQASILVITSTDTRDEVISKPIFIDSNVFPDSGIPSTAISQTSS
jgi:hypothetical protein